MAYDSVRQRVVLFGGVSNPGGTYNDTWEWDGDNWQQRATATAPSPRQAYVMAYDVARQRVVLFDGAFLGDTWLWDGAAWQQATPASSPPPRVGHAMTYDSGRQRIVLFGGYNGSLLGDSWEWDGTTWLAAFSPTYPPPRTRHAMAYDANKQRVVMFAGDSNPGFLGDTWEFDGTTWSQSLPVTSPPARIGHAMAYCAAQTRAVLFGGASLSGLSPPSTWIAGLPPVSATASTYGAGCGTPALSMTPDPGSRPVLGQVTTATVSSAPTSYGAVAVGFSNESYGPFALPVTLGGVGMPGCELWQSSDILGAGLTPVSPSSLVFSLLIPNNPALLGTHAYLQGYVFAPGYNPLELVVSNGVDWLFGDI